MANKVVALIGDVSSGMPGEELSRLLRGKGFDVRCDPGQRPFEMMLALAPVPDIAIVAGWKATSSVRRHQYYVVHAYCAGRQFREYSGTDEDTLMPANVCDDVCQMLDNYAAVSAAVEQSASSSLSELRLQQSG
ncbi:MAG TPA: hypothetical protein VI483_00500 [Candidatus Paceibacterota bacterium]